MSDDDPTHADDTGTEPLPTSDPDANGEPGPDGTADAGDPPEAARDRAVLVGNDAEGLAAALERRGVSVTVAEGTGTREALEAAGVADAGLLIVTDVGLSTSIPVALEQNPDLRVAVYARDSVPEFARTVADLIVDPALLDPATVAEELLRAA